MSEYQFYEFRSIDRPLTGKEQREIDSWSSRVSPTSTGAIFIYNYGSFSKDANKMVGKYFDAMFHIANWGTTWLLFRFPKDLLDPKAIQPYCTDDEISVSEHGNYYVLEMLFSEEESYGWVEGEGILSSLIGLRQDILNGDYRSLYVAWLKACSNAREYEDLDVDIPEPALSRSLEPLNGALKSWIELLEIDQDLLSAASEGQATGTGPSPEEISVNLKLLSQDEKNDFLKRVLHEEPLLSVKLRKRLNELSAPSDPHTGGGPRRTIGEIFQETKRVKKQRQELDREKRKKKKLEKNCGHSGQREYFVARRL